MSLNDIILYFKFPHGSSGYKMKNILMKNKVSINKNLMGCKLSGQSSYQEKYNCWHKERIYVEYI